MNRSMGSSVWGLGKYIFGVVPHRTPHNDGLMMGVAKVTRVGFEVVGFVHDRRVEAPEPSGVCSSELGCNK